jgi:hypothetical protein
VENLTNDDPVEGEIFQVPGRFVAEVINELVADPSAPIVAGDLRDIEPTEGAQLPAD